jgi:TolB-like protein/Tfp pilus assembly protein PilF
MKAVPPSFRFGFFEFYPHSGELLRQGRRLRVQNQIAQTLALLVSRAGEVVLREEFRNALWSEDTFVDFDRGLNKAINGLRSVLRDSASKPRFIETLPRKGYRFIAPIEAAAVHDFGRTDAAAVMRIESLAVLPLANHSGDPEQQYFADGMTEELISAVSHIRSLRVISRTSVTRYKECGKSVPVIAKELNVDAVLEGSVARAGRRVRITAQLIDARDDRHIWSGRYERELSDVLQLQAEIAESIAGRINKLVESERKSRPPRQVHPQAYELFLKGNFFRDKMTPAALDSSIDFFTRAIALDPSFAQAYADLSQSYFFQGVFGIAPARDVFPKAKAAAVQALELNEAVTTAHTALATVHILYDWDWAKAEVECRRALQLSPQDPLVRVHMADFMSIQGRHDEAITEFRQALAMDPISRVFLGHFGLILYRARRYDEAIEQCRKALDIDATYANAMWFEALSLEKQGRLAESIGVLNKACEASGGGLHYRALLVRAYALSGERQKALEISEELQAQSKSRHVSPFDIGVVYLGLADRASAFRWLEQAYEQRVFRLIELTMPMFDDVRSDPRWKDLVGRIGLLSVNS